jgi:hypothetical protein
VKTRLNRPILSLVSGLLLSLLLSGCAGYRLGSTLPAHIRSVHVPTAVNQSAEPDIESVVTRALQQEVQRDGTLALRDAQWADTTLEVIIRTFQTEPILYTRDDRARADEYRLSISAEIRFIDHANGLDRLHQQISGEATFPASAADLTTAVRGAIEPAARDLAREIVNAIISAW